MASKKTPRRNLSAAVIEALAYLRQPSPDVESAVLTLEDIRSVDVDTEDAPAPYCVVLDEAAVDAFRILRGLPGGRVELVAELSEDDLNQIIRELVVKVGHRDVLLHAILSTVESRMSTALTIISDGIGEINHKLAAEGINLDPKAKSRYMKLDGLGKLVQAEVRNALTRRTWRQKKRKQVDDDHNSR